MGKWIGAFLGYSWGGFFGALLGFFVGGMVDRALLVRRLTPSPEERQQAQTYFFKTVFTLMGYLAKADGQVSQSEISAAEQIMTKMGLTSAHRSEAIKFFKLGSTQDFNLEALLSDFNVHCGRHSNLKQMLLVYLINMAMADGEMHAAEHDVLQKVASKLGFSSFAFEQLMRMINAQNQFKGGYYHGGQSGGQYSGGYSAGSEQTSANNLDMAYAALGVDKTISDKDLKRAYRKLMSQYHPDKLMGQGLPEDMIEEATERSKEIQVAYDLIRKSRK